MKYPPVRRYGNIDSEDFDAYYARWPARLQAIPRQVVQDWVHRHWRDFKQHWIDLAPHTWRYDSEVFSNAEILSIDHIATWIPELDAEGVEYVSGAPRGQTRMAQYMLNHGTFPVPILVARNAGHVVHPRSAREPMKEPLQLIEGHCRLACLRGMINANYPSLALRHRVWVATIPRPVNEA
jgi:hypothetical protein